MVRDEEMPVSRISQSQDTYSAFCHYFQHQTDGENIVQTAIRGGIGLLNGWDMLLKRG
jgi:hypothetical protein